MHEIDEEWYQELPGPNGFGFHGPQLPKSMFEVQSPNGSKCTSLGKKQNGMVKMLFFTIYQISF